eukprot:COSAG01_NODE_7325_length_3250_cov_128.583624_5_plen_169_part_00
MGEGRGRRECPKMGGTYPDHPPGHPWGPLWWPGGRPGGARAGRRRALVIMIRIEQLDLGGLRGSQPALSLQQDKEQQAAGTQERRWYCQPPSFPCHSTRLPPSAPSDCVCWRRIWRDPPCKSESKCCVWWRLAKDCRCCPKTTLRTRSWRSNCRQSSTTSLQLGCQRA